MTLISPPISTLLMRAKAERSRHIAHNLQFTEIRKYTTVKNTFRSTY